MIDGSSDTKHTRDDLPDSHLANPWWHTATRYVLCYLIWVFAAAGAFWLLFMIRNLVVGLAILAHMNPWAVQATDKWGLFVLGLAWLLVIIWMESHLRSNVQRGRLWVSTRRILLIEVLLAGATYGIDLLLK